MQTVSTVSKNLGISNRMLRYYEQIGLIESRRVEGYAYRVYDERMVNRLRQIIILRKLRVPVKQIREIFANENAVGIIEVFERNISELDAEITALSTVRSILNRLVNELREKANVQLQLDYLGDGSFFTVVDGISLPKNILQEEISMSDLIQAGEKLDKLTDKNVRIVYLPPSDVAAFQCGEYDGTYKPEGYVGDVVSKFVRESGLLKVKPDIRQYGFNAPDPVDETNHHGYEMWVTIPEGFDVPAPLVKKHFPGGLYGAHMMNIPEFEEWGKLFKWLEVSEKYEFRSDTSRGGENMNGLLEECLNYYHQVENSGADSKWSPTQLDLLIPIKLKA